MRLLICDTREKKNQHVLDYLKANDVPFVVRKLDYGDYQDHERKHICIDRKQNIAELAKNVTRERDRFVKEIERAKADSSQLVILVEQNKYKDRDNWILVRDISDLMLWSNEHTKIRGEKVFRVLSELKYKYNLSVVFCDKRTTARKILQIIYGEF